MTYAAIVLLLWAALADGVRDAWITKPSWWQRHIAKWLAWYPPLIWILVNDVPPLFWLFMPFLGWYFWRLGARDIGGAQGWGSIWKGDAP